MPEKLQRAPTLYGIIVFKLSKGLLLLLLAAGVYALSDNDLPADFVSWIRFFHLDPERKFFTHLAANIAQVTPSNVIWVAVGSGFYSLFSLVEGVGLVFRIAWAGWLAIGESLFFIPIEVVELRRHHSITIAIVLILNIFIFGYLFQNRKRLFHHHAHAQPAGQTITTAIPDKQDRSEIGGAKSG
jgi:uncharacterized membrane protein (DUF2068 family)